MWIDLLLLFVCVVGMMFVVIVVVELLFDLLVLYVGFYGLWVGLCSSDFVVVLKLSLGVVVWLKVVKFVCLKCVISLLLVGGM